MRDYLLVYVNGKPHQIAGADAFVPLSSFLRYGQGATGTKVVCEEGDCGACTVLLGRLENGEIVYKPVNSCIQFMYQLDCSHIVTIEGLKLNGELNPVQESMVNNHGAQCGYCTPGFIVAMCSLFDCKTKVTPQDVKDACTGNLCRCTGYEPIIRAGMNVDTQRLVKIETMYPSAKIKDAFKKNSLNPISIECGGRKFFNPIDVASAVKFKQDHPGTVIVSGGTDVCVQANKRGFEPESLMSVSNIPGLDGLKIENGNLLIGAKVSLQALEYFVKDVVPEFYEILRVFGSPQIKHAGTLAGNIANASPIADTLPFLFVMDAEVEFAGVKGRRWGKIRSLYKGYKQLDWRPDEIITQIRVPIPVKQETLKLYKVSKRKNLDISTFTAAIRMRLSGRSIEQVALSYGGVAPVVLMLPKTAEFLTGKEHSLDTFQQAGEIAKKEISPISDVRGSSDFRYHLAGTILERFYYETADERELACR